MGKILIEKVAPEGENLKVTATFAGLKAVWQAEQCGHMVGAAKVLDGKGKVLEVLGAGPLSTLGKNLTAALKAHLAD